MNFTNRFASIAALAAAGTMAATPLAAAELPRTAPPVAVAAPGIFDADAVNADQYRYYRRNRVDAGDVIGAVVVLGTIAAVASAVGKSGRTRGDEYRYPQQRYPYPDQRYPGNDGRYDYRSNAPDGRYDGGRGIDDAVDMCAREVERNARIETVDCGHPFGRWMARLGPPEHRRQFQLRDRLGRTRPQRRLRKRRRLPRLGRGRRRAVGRSTLRCGARVARRFDASGCRSGADRRRRSLRHRRVARLQRLRSLFSA